MDFHHGDDNHLRSKELPIDFDLRQKDELFEPTERVTTVGTPVTIALGGG
jgi:hypothetical protein